MKNVDPETVMRAIGCVSELELGQFVGKLQIDNFPGLTELDAASLRAESPDQDAKAKRFELITAVRGGRHVEISADATTFRQRPKSNRRYLRLADDQLEASAPSWKGLPFLFDHVTWKMDASKGTILSSKAVQESTNVWAFEQQLHIVDPQAVIYALDGRLNKFSIGWFPTGPVLCSVHGCDVRKMDSCSCWPGDQVSLDGKATKTVEYIFTTYAGKETSGVVIPAVQDTSMEDVRAALAAEIGIPKTRSRIATVRDLNQENSMKWTRLAAALKLAALSEDDESAALAAVQALEQRAVTAENNLATTRTDLQQAQTAIRTLTATAVGLQIDAVLAEHGYRAGKLRNNRDEADPTKIRPSAMEGFLRKLAVSEGLDGLRAALAEMPVIVPVGQRLQSELAASPAQVELDEDTWLTAENPYIASAAGQLGIDVKDVVAYGKGHVTNWGEG